MCSRSMGSCERVCVCSRSMGTCEDDSRKPKDSILRGPQWRVVIYKAFVFYFLLHNHFMNIKKKIAFSGEVKDSVFFLFFFYFTRELDLYSPLALSLHPSLHPSLPPCPHSPPTRENSKPHPPAHPSTARELTDHPPKDFVFIKPLVLRTHKPWSKSL